MTLLLSDSDVRQVCDIAALVDVLEDSLSKEAKGSGAIVPERMNLAHGERFLRVMPAVLPEAGLLGLKFFHGSMREGVRYVVTVCDLDSGKVLGLVDGAYLTAARTGATSGVATRHMAREHTPVVGLIGSGLEAETNLRAVCAVRQVRTVRVYSRSVTRRAGFAERMSRQLGIEVVSVEEPESAVDGADVVVVATNTGLGGGTAYHGAWLQPGQHIVSIGSTSPALREIDPDTFLGSDAVVFDVGLGQLRSESGDVKELLEQAPGWATGLRLDDLLTGDAVARHQPSDVTLFKSVGTPAQDLIGAMYVLREARSRGIGTEVNDIASPKQF